MKNRILSLNGGVYETAKGFLQNSGLQHNTYGITISDQPPGAIR